MLSRFPLRDIFLSNCSTKSVFNKTNFTFVGQPNFYHNDFLKSCHGYSVIQCTQLDKTFWASVCYPVLYVAEVRAAGDNVVRLPLPDRHLTDPHRKLLPCKPAEEVGFDF